MTFLSKGQIDLICEQYEAFRTPANCGPSSIEKFLDSLDLLSENKTLLISELAQIDIQLIWMHWDKQLAKVAEERSSEEVESDFNRLPKISDYIALVSGAHALKHEALSEMAKCEMEARNSWGDAIGPIHYAKYGIQLADDSHHQPNVLNYTFDGSSLGRNIPKFTLRGKTLIGRQRSADTSDLFCEELAEGNRIVIANRTEAKISREQLSIQLLSPKFALVTNLSTVNSILVTNIGPLEPTRSTVLRFDFGIRLPGRRLHFSRLGD